MLNSAQVKQGVLIATLAGAVAVGMTWMIAIPVIQSDQAALRKDLERIEYRLERRMERMEERMLVPAWERDRNRQRPSNQSLTSPDPDPRESTRAPMPFIDNRVAIGRRDP